MIDDGFDKGPATGGETAIDRLQMTGEAAKSDGPLHIGSSRSFDSSAWPVSLRPSFTLGGHTYLPIGLGAQAAVYGLGNRILKVGHQFHQAFEIYEQTADAGHSLVSALRTCQSWGKLIERLRQHIASGRVNPELIANTEIEDSGLVWQERITPVEARLDQNNLGAYDPRVIRKLIDSFAEYFPLAWRSGMTETECSLFSNYGFYDNGSLTMPDFGNVTFDFESAKKSIRGTVSKKDVEWFIIGEQVPQNENWPDWFFRGQVREAFRGHAELLRYYVDKMSSTLTLENLYLQWPLEYRGGV